MNKELNLTSIVAIYTRVSTTQQADEGYSLGAQEDKLQKLCELNNYNIYKHYSDEGISGKDTTHRPAFNKMIEDMKNNKFKKIIVVKLDRLTRSLLDLELLMVELKKYDCDLVSANEEIDTSSSVGMVFIRLLGIFAQFERERIAERIKDANIEKVRLGTALSGNQPKGYMVEPISKKIIKKEDEKEFIEDLFNYFEKTNSLNNTAIYLNAKYPNIAKKGFSTQHIKNMITNEMYTGSYRGNENYCEPYITKDRWLKLNELRKKENYKGHVNTFIFSGLLVCEKCGNKHVGNISRYNTHKNFYYRCTRAVHKNTCSNHKNHSEILIENNLIMNLNNYVNNALKKELNNLEYSEKIKNSKNAKVEIEKLNERKKRIINSYNKGWIDEEEAEKEIINIDKKIKSLELIPKPKDINKLKPLIDFDFNSLYNELDRENKRIFWKNIIEKMVIDEKKYANREADFLIITFKY